MLHRTEPREALSPVSERVTMPLVSERAANARIIVVVVPVLFITAAASSASLPKGFSPFSRLASTALAEQPNDRVDLRPFARLPLPLL